VCLQLLANFYTFSPYFWLKQVLSGSNVTTNSSKTVKKDHIFYIEIRLAKRPGVKKQEEGMKKVLEFPEAQVLSRQIRECLSGKEIKGVIVGQSPHKFAFFTEPENYPFLLEGKKIKTAEGSGGFLQISVGDDVSLLIGDGGRVRFHQPGEKLPPKHQLLLKFNDGSALTVSIQMYGMIFCQKDEDIDNRYVLISREKPSPLSEKFNHEYWEKLIGENKPTLSTKAFLATEQRIPGLGNGVLQDILYRARVHPKTRVGCFSPGDRENLFQSIRATLEEMVEKGGRDTEVDLWGNYGGYKTLMSKNTVGLDCSECSTIIEKQSYMGGSVYFCPGCQPVKK